ncbi:uncharacterized protein [Nerophis lumbriciformis]|uniref:uncharacterized protein n=1 Tax=Nerophis lumbriciformis TaxID=546530 RepID=UPI002ADF84E9|nr:uncharacterized protein si:ch73-52p7.1 [Nerophis lumbriciformis]
MFEPNQELDPSKFPTRQPVHKSAMPGVALQALAAKFNCEVRASITEVSLEDVDRTSFFCHEHEQHAKESDARPKPSIATLGSLNARHRLPNQTTHQDYARRCPAIRVPNRHPTSSQDGRRAPPPAVMASLCPPVPFLCVLLWVCTALQRVAYISHNSFFCYSCSQEPEPCEVAALADCRCKDITLSALHRPPSPASPVFSMRRLTVWYTSPWNAARLLNNSEVRHLTLMYCGPGSSRERAAPPLEGHFAVQHLERLSVVTFASTDAHGDNHLHLHAMGPPDSPRVQDIYLGREQGAAYQEQARLGVVHTSVLGGGASVKVYTVQTHIDSDGTLPFPELRLPKLPETSVVYVSFVYG